MTSTYRSAVLGSLGVVLSLVSSSARGQTATAAAEALFEQGRAELALKNYDSACSKLRQSDELDPALGTKLNLAECEADRGRVATAWELYRAVEQKLPTSDPRYPIAKQGREAAEGRLPKLTLVLAHGAPTDTRVSEGSTALSTSAFGIPLPFDPGVHELTVSASGHAAAKVSVVLELGKTSTVEVAPGPALAAAPPATVPLGTSPVVPVGPATAHAPAARSSSDHRALAFTFGGIGVAGLITGAVAGALTAKAESDNRAHCDATTHSCDQQGRDAAATGRVLGPVTTAGFAVAAIGLGLGAYFLLSGDSGTKTGLVTTIGPRDSQIALTRNW